MLTINRACGALSAARAGRVTDEPWDAKSIARSQANAHCFVAIDSDFKPDQPAHWKFPVMKGNIVYYHGAANAEARAAGQPEIARVCKEIAQACRDHLEKDKSLSSLLERYARSGDMITSHGDVKPTPGESYSRLVMHLPAAISSHCDSIRAAIPAHDRHETWDNITGFGVHGHHVEVKSAMTKDVDPADIRDALQGEKTIRARVDHTFFTSTPEHDTVCLGIDSSDVHRIHGKVHGSQSHQDTQFGFLPHAEVARVKSGTGQKYIADATAEGKNFTVSELHFEHHDGKITKIPLDAAD
jgi:hypothetical protein